MTTSSKEPNPLTYSGSNGSGFANPGYIFRVHLRISGNKIILEFHEQLLSIKIMLNSCTSIICLQFKQKENRIKSDNRLLFIKSLFLENLVQLVTISVNSSHSKATQVFLSKKQFMPSKLNGLHGN